MEKRIFMLLGLHLYTEAKLFNIIVLISLIELLIMLIVLKKRNYFVEWHDFIGLGASLCWLSYMLFLSEHLTFFSCLFYNNLYLFMMYWPYWYIKYKLGNKFD
jgi:uncharacterized membrane protein YhfC